MSTSMKIGIIGTRWGLMHVGGFRGAGAEVVALCGQDPERTRAVAAREGVPLATTDPATLCAACDVVVVASPDALHCAHVQQALAAGCAVLCEKPLARTLAEAEQLWALSAAAGSRCAVSFPYRMLPPLVALHRGLLDRPAVRHIAVTLRSGFIPWTQEDAAEPRLGASGDFGGTSHVIDAALWLMRGVPVRVQALFSGRPAHSVVVHVELSTGGILSLAHLATPDPGLWGTWTLTGAGWEASFAGGYRPEFDGWCIGPARLFESGGGWQELAPEVRPQPGHPEPWAAAHIATARAFLRTLDGQEERDLATFEAGVWVQRILDAALQSERDRRISSLPSRPQRDLGTGDTR